MPVKFDLPFTQTSHVIAFTCTLIVAVSLMFIQHDVSKGLMGVVIRLLHLASFAGWFGTQLWVTFFAGITMYRVLPRHTFGNVQSKLFPKYFLLGTILTTIAMVTFVIDNPYTQWTSKEMTQAIILGSSLITVLANVFYFNPATIKIMFQKHKFEKEVKAGQEPGKVEDDKVVELNKNPTYVALSKKFTVLHTLSAIANLLSFCAQGVHLLYIASNMEL